MGTLNVTRNSVTAGLTFCAPLYGSTLTTCGTNVMAFSSSLAPCVVKKMAAVGGKSRLR